MESSRLFIAINFNSEIKTKIKEFQANLKTPDADVKWVEPQNFHLTLKFIGDTSLSKIANIEGVLDNIAQQTSTFAINIYGTGAFPNIQRPKIIWLGMDGPINKLKQLHCTIDNCLSKIGIAKESKAFSPHLTLGRFRGGSSNGLKDKIRQFSDIKLGDITVDKISLMQSELTRFGPNYTEISCLQLKQ